METLRNLRIQLKPFKNVTSTKSFPVNKLVLTPTTIRIATQSPASNAVPLGQLLKGPEGVVSFWLMPCFVPPKPEGDSNLQGLVAAYWMVQSTDREEDANMAIDRDLTTYQAYEKPLREVAIKMPLMKNKRAIKPGDQLVVFRKKEVKVPDLCELVPLEAPTKRRRVKSAD